MQRTEGVEIGTWEKIVGGLVGLTPVGRVAELLGNRREPCEGTGLEVDLGRKDAKLFEAFFCILLFVHSVEKGNGVGE